MLTANFTTNRLPPPTVVSIFTQLFQMRMRKQNKTNKQKKPPTKDNQKRPMWMYHSRLISLPYFPNLLHTKQRWKYSLRILRVLHHTNKWRPTRGFFCEGTNRPNSIKTRHHSYIYLLCRNPQLVKIASIFHLSSRVVWPDADVIHSPLCENIICGVLEMNWRWIRPEFSLSLDSFIRKKKKEKTNTETTRYIVIELGSSPMTAEPNILHKLAASCGRTKLVRRDLPTKNKWKLPPPLNALLGFLALPPLFFSLFDLKFKKNQCTPSSESFPNHVVEAPPLEHTGSSRHFFPPLFASEPKARRTRRSLVTWFRFLFHQKGKPSHFLCPIAGRSSFPLFVAKMPRSKVSVFSSPWRPPLVLRVRDEIVQSAAAVEIKRRPFLVLSTTRTSRPPLVPLCFDPFISLPLSDPIEFNSNSTRFPRVGVRSLNCFWRKHEQMKNNGGLKWW